MKEQEKQDMKAAKSPVPVKGLGCECLQAYLATGLVSLVISPLADRVGMPALAQEMLGL